jgi:multicomponent Na+:H+ antiporter subunit F
MMSGRELFLDVAIGVALVGFVATVAWARMIDGRADNARRQP